MTNIYGFKEVDWDKAKTEVKSILIEVARRKGRIAYSELASQIESIYLEAHDPRMFHLLGEISREEDAAGRGMLTAIVVHKSGDMQPGPGFFELAKSNWPSPRGKTQRMFFCVGSASLIMCMTTGLILQLMNNSL